MRSAGDFLVFCGALALVACRGGSDADWSSKELKPTEDAASGVAFTISLPEGLKKSDAQSSETSVVWEAATNKAAGPTISVAKLALPPATLKDAVSRSGGGEITILRQEAVDDGFLVAGQSKDKGLVKVDVYRPTPEGVLWCSAMQAKEGGLSKPDDARAWLEKVCLSMASKSGAAKGPPPPVLSPEMKDFIGGFGSSAKVAEALKKHGAPDLATKDMESYDLVDPRVSKAELYGAKTCYTMEARAGETTRIYLVCWDGGKIVVIDDMGMR